MRINQGMKSIFFSVAAASAMFAWAAGASGDKLEGGLIESAEQENAEAQLSLGEWYESRHNYGEAAKWYRRAAGRGNAAAQFHLGLLYEHGQGVPQDYWEAAKWYLAAAEQGNFPARYGLGLLYAGKLGQICTDFEVKHRNLARMLGIG
jgi:TPR repeat protein